MTRGHGVADGFGGDQIITPGPLVGIRSWAIHNPRTLSSVAHSYAWTPGENIATCGKDGADFRIKCLDPSHDDRSKHMTGCYEYGPCGVESPNPACDCGFYAYASPEFDWYSMPGTTGIGDAWRTIRATGLVYGYGRFIVGDKGFRAGRAMILALVVPAVIPDKAILPTASFPRTESDLAVIESTRSEWAEQINDGLRATYKTTRFFSTLADALRVFPATRTAELVAEQDI